MNVENIKTKNTFERVGHMDIHVGQKIIIKTNDKNPLTIMEMQKIEEFVKTLRA
jgi:hypothetical protein